MRFYLDEDLSPKIAEIVRSQYNLDVLSTHECQRLEQPDEQQLLFASQENRCLVTKNEADFRRWSAYFVEQAVPHAGILIVSRDLPGDRFADIAAALARYQERYPEGLPPYCLDYLHAVAPRR